MFLKYIYRKWMKWKKIWEYEHNLNLIAMQRTRLMLDYRDIKGRMEMHEKDIKESETEIEQLKADCTSNEELIKELRDQIKNFGPEEQKEIDGDVVSLTDLKKQLAETETYLKEDRQKIQDLQAGIPILQQQLTGIEKNCPQCHQKVVENGLEVLKKRQLEKLADSRKEATNIARWINELKKQGGTDI